MNVSREEMLRYLGSRGFVPDERTSARMDAAIAVVRAVSVPRRIFRRLPLSALPLEGKDVYAHLDGCKEAYLFAATLGTGPEREEEKAFAGGDSLGAVLTDTAASCLIESYCDEECEKLAESEDVTLTTRFSCGYGDWPLERQTDILRLLDAQRRIGLYVSDGGMMIPRKSVTAVMGVLADGYSALSAEAHTADKCAKCAALSCPYRKAPARYSGSDNG